MMSALDIPIGYKGPFPMDEFLDALSLSPLLLIRHMPGYVLYDAMPLDYEETWHGYR